MTEVLFYHLTRSPVEVTLMELLEKTRARGWKAVVLCRSDERARWLDQKLWLGEDTGFAAHGVAGGPHDAGQPVLLTTGPGAANNAEIMLALDGAEIDVDGFSAFERVCVLFEGHVESALECARAQWKQVTAAGLPAHYWAQDDGRWVEKASANT